jgi:hypothetical protein
MRMPRCDLRGSRCSWLGTQTYTRRLLSSHTNGRQGSDRPSNFVFTHTCLAPGTPRAVCAVELLRELTQRRFNDVDAAFAHDEGDAIGVLRTGDRQTRDISPVSVSLLRTCCSIVNVSRSLSASKEPVRVEMEIAKACRPNDPSER